METVVQQGKREIVGLAFTVLTVVAVSVTAKVMSDPDAMRSFKMRVARYVGARSDKVALLFLNLSDLAGTVYENER